MLCGVFLIVRLLFTQFTEAMLGTALRVEVSSGSALNESEASLWLLNLLSSFLPPGLPGLFWG